MGYFSVNFFLSVACVTVLTSLHITEALLSKSDAVMYLGRYGYVPSKYSQRKGQYLAQEDLRNAIKSFQILAGLPITGILDKETRNKMTLRRCGNPDITGTEETSRFSIQGSKWRSKALTYKITKYTSDISNDEADAEIAEAFKLWEDQTDLTFTKAQQYEYPDIEIQFAQGDHGDGAPFDGLGETYAHAFYPSFGGDAHFDDAEHWSLQSGIGTVNLRIVAAHEFGHSLGLNHTDVEDAIMAPFYNPWITKLHSDDILGIQRLYGPPSNEQTSPSTTINDSFLLRGRYFSFLSIIGLMSAWLNLVATNIL